MNIIAFTGKKGTGKSTACNYLENQYNFTRVNFKDALITELKQNFPDLLREISSKHYALNNNEILIGDDAIDSLFVSKPPLIRTLMQNYGTNVRRNGNPNYWVDIWKNKIGFDTEFSVSNTTTDDCRFISEAEAIREHDGIIIRLIRTDMIHTDTHQSETEMDSIVPDFTIVCNGGDEEHLAVELDKIMAQVDNSSLTK